MTDLLKYREAMIQACTIAIDQMISAADNENLLKAKLGSTFESELLIRFLDTNLDVRSRPALNLTRDLQEQLTTRSYTHDPPPETIVMPEVPSVPEILSGKAARNGKKSRSIIPKKTP